MDEARRAEIEVVVPDDGDPFDRMIVATAARYGVPLVTADERLRDLPTVGTTW